MTATNTHGTSYNSTTAFKHFFNCQDFYIELRWMWILNLGIPEGNTQKAESTSREIVFTGQERNKVMLGQGSITRTLKSTYFASGSLSRNQAFIFLTLLMTDIPTRGGLADLVKMYVETIRIIFLHRSNNTLILQVRQVRSRTILNIKI